MKLVEFKANRWPVLMLGWILLSGCAHPYHRSDVLLLPPTKDSTICVSVDATFDVPRTDQLPSLAMDEAEKRMSFLQRGLRPYGIEVDCTPALAKYRLFLKYHPSSGDKSDYSGFEHFLNIITGSLYPYAATTDLVVKLERISTKATLVNETLPIEWAVGKTDPPFVDPFDVIRTHHVAGLPLALGFQLTANAVKKDLKLSQK